MNNKQFDVRAVNIYDLMNSFDAEVDCNFYLQI